jgi:hypothetical protein
MKNVLLILSFTALLAAPARAAIRVTAEQPVANPVPAPQPGDQYALTITTDGEQFLTLWGSDGGGDGNAGLNAALVAADGRWLWSRFIPGAPNAVHGVIAAYWSGSAYVVWWNEASGISIVALSRSGDLLRSPTVVIPGAWAPQDALAWNGSRGLIFYVDATTKKLRGAQFDAAGSLINTEISIPAIGIGNYYSDRVPIVASDGNGFVAVWATGRDVSDPSAIYYKHYTVRDVHLVRITQDGELTGAGIDIGTVVGSDEAVGLTFGRGLYAITTEEGDLQSPLGLRYLVRFVVNARTGSVMRLPASSHVTGGYPSAFWNGARFVVYWTEGTSLLKTVSFSGNAAAQAPEPGTAFIFPRLPADRAAPVSTSLVFMASNGQNVFCAWAPGDIPRSPVFGSRFNADATAAVDPPQVISISWSRQSLPSIATSGRDALVVWTEQGGDVNNGRLVGARLSSSGAAIDATPFEIAPSVSIRFGTPAVVFTGTVYLVAWVDGAYESSHVVKVRSVSRDGSLTAPMSLGGGSYVSAATNGTTTLVVLGTSFGSNRVAGCRFDEIGNRIDQTPIIISADGSRPRVASNGSDFFVAWAEGDDFYFDPIFPPPASLFDIFGARVSASGAVDAAPLPIAIGPSDQVLAGLASDGRDYLVSYVDNGNPNDSSPQPFLAAKHILREGNLDGATATGDGTIVARNIASAGAYTLGVGGGLSGDASGYWAAFRQTNGAPAIVRTNLRGVPGSEQVSFVPSSALTLAQIPGGPVWIAYAHRVDDGAFANTSQVFIRSATGEPSIPRSRAARH